MDTFGKYHPLWVATGCFVKLTGQFAFLSHGFTCEKATVTDNGYLVIAIDAESASGYDTLASQFLEEAKKEGVSKQYVVLFKVIAD